MPRAADSSPSARNKQRRRDTLQLRIAALLTSHAPASRIKLAPDPALKVYSELDFDPVGTAANGVGFGLLRSGYLPRGLHFGRLPVKRGRWGSKAPEELQLLQPVPAELLAQPAIKQRAALRSLASAYADVLASLPPSRQYDNTAAALLLLAAEFSLVGWMETERLRRFAVMRGETTPQLQRSANSGVVHSDGLLIWRSYLRRLSLRLGNLLQHPRQRNPLRRELSETQTTLLLDLPRPELAAAVLEDFAALHQLPPAQRRFPRSYLLTGALAPAMMTSEDAAFAAQMLKLIAAEPSLSRRDLAARFASQLHVLAWLYDSEQLIELPGWLSITQSDLRRYLRSFPAGPGKPAPAVRELKDRLGLGRREAEGLRAWYCKHCTGGAAR